MSRGAGAFESQGAHRVQSLRPGRGISRTSEVSPLLVTLRAGAWCVASRRGFHSYRSPGAAVTGPVADAMYNGQVGACTFSYRGT